MKKILIFIITCLVFTSCSKTVFLYPYSGPIVENKNVRVLKAKASGITGNTGKITITLPSGEVLNGRWASMAPMEVTYSQGSSRGYASDGMRSIWAKVYGSGYTIRNKPGVNKGEAYLVGSKGITLEIEFYTGSGTANGTGVAKDNKGNIYKVIF